MNQRRFLIVQSESQKKDYRCELHELASEFKATPSIPSWNQLYDWLKQLASVRQVAVDTGYMEATL